MKKTTAYWFLLLLLMVIASLAVVYAVWNKPHENIEAVDGIKIPATELFLAFTENEKKAAEKYNGKVLEVTGTVSAVETNQQGQTIIRLQSNDVLFGINCSMEQKTTVQVAATVTIKGSCSGFTTDVVLIHCYLIK